MAKQIIIKGLDDFESKLAIDWFKEIEDRYEHHVNYTNEIIDAHSNNLTFDMIGFTVIPHDTYMEILYNNNRSGDDKWTFEDYEFDEITLKY